MYKRKMFVLAVSFILIIVISNQSAFAEESENNSYKVYVDKSSSQKEKYLFIINNSFEYWESIIPSLQLTLTENNEASNFDITFVPIFDSKDIGTVKSGIKPIIKVTDKLIIGGKLKQVPQEDMKKILTHEIGHMLGLCHSNDPNDVMYPTDNESITYTEVVTGFKTLTECNLHEKGFSIVTTDMMLDRMFQTTSKDYWNEVLAGSQTIEKLPNAMQSSLPERIIDKMLIDEIVSKLDITPTKLQKIKFLLFEIKSEWLIQYPSIPERVINKILMDKVVSKLDITPTELQDIESSLFTLKFKIHTQYPSLSEQIIDEILQEELITKSDITPTELQDIESSLFKFKSKIHMLYQTTEGSSKLTAREKILQVLNSDLSDLFQKKKMGMTELKDKQQGKISKFILTLKNLNAEWDEALEERMDYSDTDLSFKQKDIFMKKYEEEDKFFYDEIANVNKQILLSHTKINMLDSRIHLIDTLILYNESISTANGHVFEN